MYDVHTVHLTSCVMCNGVQQVADHPGAFVVAAGGFGRLVSMYIE